MTRGKGSLLAGLVLAPIAILVGVVVFGAATKIEGPRTPIKREALDAAGDTADAADAVDEADVEPAADEEKPAAAFVDISEPEYRAALADKPPFGNDVTRAVCGKLPGCRVQRRRNVGSDAAGRTISLVTSITTVSEHPPRFAVEHWALLSTGAVIVDRQLLFRDQPRWPNEADEKKAEDLAMRLKVTGRTLSYQAAYSGFGWRSMAYSHTFDFSLDDLRLVREVHEVGWHGSRTLRIDLDSALATENWKMAACDASYSMRSASDGTAVGVPILSLGKQFNTDWRTTDFGSCVPMIDGSAAGFALEGTADWVDRRASSRAKFSRRAWSAASITWRSSISSAMRSDLGAKDSAMAPHGAAAEFFLSRGDAKDARMRSMFLAVVLACVACKSEPPSLQKDPAPGAANGPNLPSNVASPPANPAALNDPSLATEQAPATYRARFLTTKGSFTIQVTRDWAPLAADRFYNLVKIGYYNGIRFFRVVDGFMAQFGIHGDPGVSAKWRGASINDEPVVQGNKRGRVTFAKGGPNSRTTQVFINFVDNLRLDPMGFPSFGEIVDGMNVVDALYKGYGEGAPAGKGPNQGRMQMEGNSYLVKEFPELDWIKEATIAP